MTRKKNTVTEFSLFHVRLVADNSFYYIPREILQTQEITRKVYKIGELRLPVKFTNIED